MSAEDAMTLALIMQSAMMQRPCIRSCEIGARKIDEDRKAYIDDSKCVSCGACVHMCPFGAIVDKPFVLDVLKLLKESENKYQI